MDLAGVELTRIWSKGPMCLAPVQGLFALSRFVRRIQGSKIEELSASFVGYPTQVYTQFTCTYDGPTG
jgi:hypothetical protein